MARFRYRAVDAAGQVVDGELEATDRAAVVQDLRRHGLRPLRTAETRRQQHRRGFSVLRAPRPGRSRELALFFRELSTLLGAGLPLDAALSTIARQDDGSATTRIAHDVLDGVQAGAGLPDALAKQPVQVPGYVLALLRAGEAGGTLKDVLADVAEGLERAYATEQEIRTALTYPALVVLATLVSMLILLVGVVPEFEPLFADAASELPISTQVVLVMSDALRAYWWAMLATFGGLVVMAPPLFRRPRFRLALDTAVLRLPLIGPIVRKHETGRFCQTMGMLLANGVQVVPALDLGVGTFTNRHLADQIAPVSGQLRRGEGLAEPLAGTGVFPRLALELIRVGEASSQLDRLLLTVAAIYVEEVRRAIRRLISLLVPITTLFLGVLVAAVIGSILSAILASYNVPI